LSGASQSADPSPAAHHGHFASARDTNAVPDEHQEM
jgi:hypothetical protein